MAKSFKKDLKKRDYITVLNSSKNEEELPKEKSKVESEKPKSEKQGRGEVQEEEKKYIPRTLKIRSDIWAKSQALAWWDRESLQEFFTKVLEQHISSIPEDELANIIEKYNKK